MSAEEHKSHAPTRVRVWVVTISDTRTEENDVGGGIARDLIEAWGHELAGYTLLRDEPAQVAQLIRNIAERKEADVVVTSGGTGISRRDSTYEAIHGLLEKRLDGFGELFRVLSYQDPHVGAAAMLSRAVAGLHRGVVVFATPGSPGAVKLALERLILPELGHLVFEKTR